MITHSAGLRLQERLQLNPTNRKFHFELWLARYEGNVFGARQSTLHVAALNNKCIEEVFFDLTSRKCATGCIF